MMQGNEADTRAEQVVQLLREHASLATPEFWDRFHAAVQELVNGNTEQICLNRQNDQGPIQVQWEPVTLGQRERWGMHTGGQGH